MSDLDQKYALIWDHEARFAYRLGREVIEKPTVSAWMILLPVLFVHHLYRIDRYKEGVRSFARGILDSKQKALDKALEDVASGEEKEYRPEDYLPHLKSTSDRDRVLSTKQVQVIRVQQKHYRSLLAAEGASYEELLKHVYSSAGQYRRFLNRLAAAEQELNRYLTEKVHTSEQSRAVVQRIEKCCADFREAEIRALF